MLEGDRMDSKKLVIRPKRPKGEDGYKTFSIRIREDLADRIGDISARTGHSRNELIGRFLEYAVDRCTIIDK